MAFIGRLHPRLIHFPIALDMAAAALPTSGTLSRSVLDMWIYRIALFAAGTLVAVTGRLGGLLVWGANFLRP
jgi:uncharacterized membrane protein